MAGSRYCLLGKYGQVSETQWCLGPGLGRRHLINVHRVYTAEQLKLRAYFPPLLSQAASLLQEGLLVSMVTEASLQNPACPACPAEPRLCGAFPPQHSLLSSLASF